MTSNKPPKGRPHTGRLFSFPDTGTWEDGEQSACNLTELPGEFAGHRDESVKAMQVAPLRVASLDALALARHACPRFGNAAGPCIY